MEAQNQKQETRQLIKQPPQSLSLLAANPTPHIVKQTALELTKGGDVNFPAIIQHGTGLAVIARTHGDLYMKSILITMISDFNHAFNVVRRMDVNQVASYAEDLAAEYYGWKIEDFACFFHVAKRGDLSINRDLIIRDRIDAQMLNSLLAVYEKQRLEKTIEMDTAWQRSSPPEVKGAKYVDIKPGTLKKWLEEPPTKEEVEEHLGRPMTEDELKIFNESRA